jgi:hypothetical protein
MVLDLDATDDPIHGEQEGRFFHAYYVYYQRSPERTVADTHPTQGAGRPRPEAGEDCLSQHVRPRL